MKRISCQQRVLNELKLMQKRVRPARNVRGKQAKLVRATLKRQIDRAGIAVLLASDPSEASRIYEYVDYPFNQLMLGPKPKTLEEVTRLVAQNLDWYIGPPRRLFRPEWVLLPGIILVMLLVTITLIALAGGVVTNIGLPVAIVPLLWVTWYYVCRENIRGDWVLALFEYLDDLYADNAGEAQAIRPIKAAWYRRP
ncbi:hypothetical protein JW859_09255 [bacterium]|nr:hypothetical protein [bacterium]